MGGEEWTATVAELQGSGVLLVEDGNHGEYRPLAGEFVKDGTPFVRPDDLKGGRIDFGNCDRINDTANNRVRKGKGQAGDIVFTHRATVGRIARAGPHAPNFVANPGVTVWRSIKHDVLDPTYLYFFMQSEPFMRQVWAQAGNTDTFPYVSLTQQRTLEITAPAIQRQRAIARILGTLDDKIELNRRMNETLEAIARTIFQSWFVDFNPVRAKASGEPPESICRRLGLTPELLSLFPDRLVDSEIGEIPEGWEVKALAQVTSYLNRGLSPKYVETGGVLVLNQKCVRDGRVATSKARRHDPAQRSVAGRLVEVGDVLVNSTGVGTLGRVAQVLAIDEPMIVDSHVTVVRADPAQMSWNFLGVAMQERESDIEALGEGSTGQTELSRVRLGGLPLVMPPKPLCNYFDEAVRPLRLHTKRNDEQNVTLASIRDALLPKLLSGELRVPPEAVASP